MIRQSSSAGLANTYITRIKNYVKCLQKKEGKKDKTKLYIGIRSQECSSVPVLLIIVLELLTHIHARTHW